MKANPRLWLRKLHRWGAILSALPFVVVIVSGLLLQWKKEVPWIQPPMQKGSGRVPTVSFDAILAAAQTVPEGEVQGWQDIDRLDVRPGQGIVKVQCKNGWEIQVDTGRAVVLQAAYRRSDLIEAIHDGSWFYPGAKLSVFFVSGLVVLGLWLTGLYLFFLPHMVRWSRRRQKAAAGVDRDVST